MAPPVSASSRAASALLRRPHAAGILRQIWAERSISRAELARRSALARSTVSQTVQALQACGLVGEEGTGPSRGGRRPTLLRFEDEAFGVAGVDLGHAHLAVVLIDLRGRVLAWEERRHPVREDPAGARAAAAELLEACLLRWSRPRERLVAIGVAVPSPVDRGAARPLSRVALPAWQGEPGLEALAARFGVPVLVDNDANLGALAEHWWGAGRRVRDLAYVLLGDGVGAGHLVDGRIYRGVRGLAGELGHVPVDPAGPPCACGMRGCLTTLVDVPAVLARAAALRPARPGAAPSSIAALEEAARAGDPAAVQVVEETARWLGLGLSALRNLLDPALVILGGGVARLGEVLLVPLRRSLRGPGVAASSGAEVVVSPLAERAIALGAATHALESALADPGLFPTVRALG